MKKGIVIVGAFIFVVTFLLSGCGKSEEKKVEAPSEIKQTVEKKATAVAEKTEAVTKEAVEKGEATAETAGEKTATMTEQAVETAKQMGQQAMESASEKMPEEVKQAVDAAKQYSGGQPTAIDEGKAAIDVRAREVETPPAPSSLEETAKEKAIEQGIKLPSKY